VEANTALRAVPAAAALHPAEPLVADGVLTAALAAALGPGGVPSPGVAPRAEPGALAGRPPAAPSRPGTAGSRRPSTAGECRALQRCLYRAGASQRGMSGHTKGAKWLSGCLGARRACPDAQR
jgi:hypothetical protein